ncbi:MAG: SIS domain-containing protein, partial [Ignavibacteria bacterium]|nr:SIS domain-containing protein [Ignavibacteria bacterium]
MSPYKEYDSGNMFDALVEFPEQIKNAWEAKIQINKQNFSGIKNIIVSGLGGSAISGDIAQAFLKDHLNIPLTVNRSYDLPYFTNNETLLIACSYSGNTEETISVLKQAIARGVKTVCITSHGEIQDLAQKNNLNYVNVPKGFQPRCAFGLMFFSLIKILN